eukprot:CAMPEP_0115007526 /NCGR_PEP_ID=MMETSP0216-20121206/21252_1 /TAXON_ID=223996 /ORGANISM="Protocruzia adherens, Strain Boccale" /LENGTH=34 /DNA_ID= /DNA_START= /DNA_END= /DNA_ORIENTATION=
MKAPSTMRLVILSNRRLLEGKRNENVSYDAKKKE